MRVYFLVFISAVCFGGLKAQSFTVSFPDTIVYGPAIDSSSLSCWINDDVINVSGSTLVLDVVRVENVTSPGWTSAFCFQICSQPTVDSIRAVMAPNEVVNIAIHFIITGIPDSSTILMKFKNVNNPSEVIYQRFYGISQNTAGINQNGDLSEVIVYPNPASTVLNLRFQNKAMVHIELFNSEGKKVLEDTHNRSSAVRLETSHLLPGLYFLQCKDEMGQIYSRRVAIVR